MHLFYIRQIIKQNCEPLLKNEMNNQQWCIQKIHVCLRRVYGKISFPCKSTSYILSGHGTVVVVRESGELVSQKLTIT